MRLWHKDLIPYLPRKQLVAQWRECCAIAGSVAKKGTPNHMLVNKILKFPSVHFLEYTRLIRSEMIKRRYSINHVSEDNFVRNFRSYGSPSETLIGMRIEDVIFAGWHNDRYLRQCLFNLQEKYDCGGISEEEWKVIENHFDEYLD